MKKEKSKMAKPTTKQTPPAKQASITELPVRKKPKALPISKKMAVRVNRNITILENAHGRIKKWKDDHGLDGVKEQLATALEALHGASETLQKVPDDFIPWKVGGGSTKREIAEGDMVRLTDKRKGEYTDMLEADEMSDLKVVAARGSSLLVESAVEGTKFLIRRAHLMLQESD